MFDDALGFLADKAAQALAVQLGLPPGSRPVELASLARDHSPGTLTLTLLRVEPISLRSEQRFRAHGASLESLAPRSFRLIVLAAAHPEDGPTGYRGALDMLGRFTSWVVDNPVFDQERYPELQSHPLERLMVAMDEMPLGDVLMLWQSFGVHPRPSLPLEVQMLAYGNEKPLLRAPEVGEGAGGA